MKTFIKYFILLAVCTNALAMDDWNRIDRGMSTSEDYFAHYAADSKSDRTSRAVDPSQNTHDKASFGDDSDVLGYDRSERARYELDYPYGLDAACLQWPDKPSSEKFTANTKDEAKREFEYDEAPSSCSLHELQQPSRKKRKSAPSSVAPAISIEDSTTDNEFPRSYFIGSVADIGPVVPTCTVVPLDASSSDNPHQSSTDYCYCLPTSTATSAASAETELDTRDKALAISPEYTAKPPRKKRELEYDEAPSSGSLHELQQPSRKKREPAPSSVAPAVSIEDSTADNEFPRSYFIGSAADIGPLGLARTVVPLDSASSSSTATPAPALLESASVAVDTATTRADATAIKARYERATNRKKAIIESLICPFRDCQFKLQGTAAEIGVIYEHIRTTHRDKQIEGKWHCDQCEKSFKSPCRITSHIYSDHLKERQFICPHCKKGFPTTPSFSHHMQNVHEEPRYHCVFCDGKYSATRDWKRHLQNHLLRDKPKLRNVGKGLIFACPCGTGCENAAELKAHSCTWKNTGVFLCPCKKMFKADGWHEHQTTCPQAQWPSKN